MQLKLFRQLLGVALDALASVCARSKSLIILRCDPECIRKINPSKKKQKSGNSLKKEAEILKKCHNNLLNKLEGKNMLKEIKDKQGVEVDSVYQEEPQNEEPREANNPTVQEQILDMDHHYTNNVEANSNSKELNMWFVFQLPCSFNFSGSFPSVIPFAGFPNAMPSNISQYSQPETFTSQFNASPHWNHLL
jgi:hypothetical protein